MEATERWRIIGEGNWRKAVCTCGFETGWRVEYSGGRCWNVFLAGSTCPECNRLFGRATDFQQGIVAGIEQGRDRVSINAMQ